MPNKKREEPRDKHAIWKGYITFGLVNIPVVLYSVNH